jgi:hypothetical protein
LRTEIVINANLPEMAEGITRDIGDVAMQVALGIEAEAKRLIQQTAPAGRIYRRAAILRATSQRLLKLGLKASRSRAGKVVAGYKFHRASAKGQPPANDTSNLVNSMKARRTGKASAELAINAGYAGFLEPPAPLGRPFVAPAIDFTLEHVLPTL